MKRILFSLILVMSLLAACSSSSTFRPKGGGFSVVAPAKLKEQTQPVGDAAGKLDAHTFMAVKNDITYVVSYSDFQADAIKGMATDTLLNNARDSMINSMSGFLLDEKSAAIDNYPGRDLSIAYSITKTQTGVISARVYLVNARLYQVMVFSTDTVYKAKDPSIARFLDSFKLTGSK